jgi:hypothetical protein
MKHSISSVFLGLSLLLANGSEAGFAQSASSDIAGFDREWLLRYAPYGADFVPTGDRVVVWANLAKVGERIDFSILGSDLERRDGYSLTTWIRGDHIRDKRVKFRTSIASVHFDCRQGTWQELSMTTFSASGKALSHSSEAQPKERAIPGSQAYRWLEFACGTGAGRPRW